METPDVVNVHAIRLKGESFYVPECEIARNYEDVSPMFVYLEDLRLRPDAVLLDVGANIGIFSLSYARLYPQAEVYAFEPHPQTFDLLARSIELNKDVARRIHPFPVGLSNRQGISSLSMPQPAQHPRYDSAGHQINCGLFSIHGNGPEKISCRLTTLDEFQTSESLTRIDFIKIDVEGHEYEVLEGAQRTLMLHRPILFIEYNELTKTLSGHPMEEFESFFDRFGYRLYGVRYGWVRELKPLSNLRQTEDVSDLVCFPKEGRLPDA